jgi:hypothetical protein
MRDEHKALSLELGAGSMELKVVGYSPSCRMEG